MNRPRAFRLSVASALLASALVQARAGAQVIESERDRGRHSSPQHFAFELKFGPYKPDIDSEFAGTSRTPYKDFFGSRRKLMTQLEFDYEIIRHVGTAGIGVGIGYFKETGSNPDAANPDKLTTDASSLRLLPFSVSAVYRFDLAYERYKIPLVPYGKLGLDYIYWTVNNGNGQVPSDPTGGSGQGGTRGWHGTLGLSLVLDFFDQNSANQFDEDLGVNHSYLFFEYGHLDASGLGQANRLRVGDDTWNAGIMFEF